MELQWPLILFTTLLAWSAGLFGFQAFAALRGWARKTQLTAWIAAAVLLAASGIAVFMHLEHWERIFNGFGHLTSGITQELIAIVVLAVVAVVYLVLLRKSGEGTVPAWCAVVAMAVCAVLVVVCGHSYMMAARPVWDTVLAVCSLLGAALLAGPLTLVALAVLCGDDVAPLPKRPADHANSVVNKIRGHCNSMVTPLPRARCGRAGCTRETGRCPHRAGGARRPHRRPPHTRPE